MTSARHQMIGILALSAAVVFGPKTASGRVVTYNVPDLLVAFFPHSDRIVYEIVETREHKDDLRKHLGYVPKRQRFVVFVAITGRDVDGYAVIDNEHGRYDPITFGIKLSADLEVQRCEVMVYRGPRGDEIRTPRFLKQFMGKKMGDSIKTPEIDVVTGATISSRATMKAVARGLLLAQIVKRRLDPSGSKPGGIQ